MLLSSLEKHWILDHTQNHECITEMEQPDSISVLLDYDHSSCRRSDENACLHYLFLRQRMSNKRCFSTTGQTPGQTETFWYVGVLSACCSRCPSGTLTKSYPCPSMRLQFVISQQVTTCILFANDLKLYGNFLINSSTNLEK